MRMFRFLFFFILLSSATSLFLLAESRAARSQHGGAPIDSKEADAGPDEARAFYERVRSFPDSFVDSKRYLEGAMHRDTMAPAVFNSSESGIQPAVTPFWQYIGPTNTGSASPFFFGPKPFSGRLDAVAYDPTHPGTYYVGSGKAGIWKTTDSGATFTCLSNSWPWNAVSSIAVDPTNGNVFAGTGDFVSWSKLGCQGLLMSTDGGSTWTHLGVSQSSAISSILIDPDNHNLITISTGFGAAGWGTISRSIDGGASWQTALTNTYFMKVVCSAAAGGTRYYYTVDRDYHHVYRSADRGVTWTDLVTPITQGAPLSVACSKVDPLTVYVLDSIHQLIYKSADAGTTWTTINGDFPTDYFSWDYPGYSQVIETSVNAGADVLYVGTTDIYQSLNGGAHWQPIGNISSAGALIHTDQHAIAFNPANPNEMLVGNDGGLYRGTFDPLANKTSFANLNATLGTMQIYKLDVHPTNASIVLSGAQDGGSPSSLTGNLQDWAGVGYGDGNFSIINPTTPSNQYVSAQNLGLYRTDNAWSTSTYIGPVNGGTFGSEWTAFQAPVAMDPNDSNTLYASGQHIYRYNLLTSTWEMNLGNFNLSPDDTILAIAVAPGDSSRIYAGGFGCMWMSEDRGGTWHSLMPGSTPLPYSSFNSINVNPNNPDDILVGAGSSYGTSLFRCINVRATDTVRVWQSVAGTGTTAIPNVSLNGIARDPDNYDSVWYVATDLGVFVTYDAGNTWANMTVPNGLPNVGCNDLKMRASDRILYVATMGRGIWRMQVPKISSMASLAIRPAAVPAGTNTTGLVTLHSAAGSSGKTVYVYSSNKTIATVPPTVTVPAGATSVTFPIQVLDTGEALSDVKISVTSGSGAQRMFIHPYRANDAQFVSQKVPATMTAGQTYAVSFVFQNSGSSTWNTAGGYKLSASPGGMDTWGATRLSVIAGTNAGPGANATFSGNVFAPLVPGAYAMQWQPMQQNVGLFGATTSSLSINVVQHGDAARYLFQRGQTTVNAGNDFYVSYAFANVGTTTWDPAAGYAAIARDPVGNSNWGISTFVVTNQHLVNGTSAPGATAFGSGKLTAPIAAGVYTYRFSMSKGGVPFGDLPPKIAVTVVNGPYNASFVNQTGVPTSVPAGSQFTATITMTNLGTSLWPRNVAPKSIGTSNFAVAQLFGPSPVSPGANGVLTATFTAPTTAGTYTFQYRMASGTMMFGQNTAPVTITVT